MRLIIIIAIFFTTSKLFAQHTISGEVISICKGNISKLPFASIQLFDSSFHSVKTSDLQGKFNFENLEGRYSIKVTAIGYQRFEGELDIKKSINNLLIVLSESAVCDFDNRLNKKKNPRLKKYVVIENKLNSKEKNY